MNGITYTMVTGLVAGGIWVGTIQVQVKENTVGRKETAEQTKETHEKVIRMDERQKQILRILKELRADTKNGD